jgi:hypothetical protein
MLVAGNAIPDRRFGPDARAVQRRAFASHRQSWDQPAPSTAAKKVVSGSSIGVRIPRMPDAAIRPSQPAQLPSETEVPVGVEHHQTVWFHEGALFTDRA